MMEKRLKLEDLNQLYTEAEQADADLFAEQRSNVLLVTGDHYTKKGSKFWSRIRDAKELSQEQKVRLTKNHIQKITKKYVNNIVSQAPGVTVMPKNEKELQDQKAAELHLAVWQDIKHRHNFKKKVREYTEDFIDIGEAFCKVFWDPNKGKFLGFEQEMDPVTGQMADTDKPKFQGDFVYERFFGFDALRDRSAKSMDESSFICFRKMMSVKEAKAIVGNDQEKLKFIQESQDETYVVFDSQQGYGSSKDHVLWREFFFRPCLTYPNGYFYVATPHGILFEGELPFGIFPIAYVGFDEIPTSARARSIIKQLRPYQAEVNRTASKIAEHQITLGDDKLLIQDGTKIVNGGSLPGIRGVKYSGMPPTVLPGRSGDQYLAYMQSQISEMYGIANVEEDDQEKQTQVDPYTLLFRSMSNKKRYSIPAEKIEGFLTQICDITLRLAKQYYDESMYVPAVGRREYINIQEFKNMDDLGHQIKIEPQSEDIETKMGKQLTLNHVLQYAAGQLGKEDIGKMIRQMPFANAEEAFSDFTLEYDNITNDILALDRGQFRPADANDNHTYCISKLLNRMRQSDFEFLNPQIQQMYQARKQQHEQLEAQRQQAIKAAQSEFIPTGGYAVALDFYVSDPKNPEKTKRARLPYEAVNWLMQRLDQQGMTQEQVAQLPPGAQESLANQILQMRQANASGAAGLQAQQPMIEGQEPRGVF